MSADRMERVNALLLREIGEALPRLVTDSHFQRAAVTVTRVETSRNLRNARVMVSILGSPEQQQIQLTCIRKFRSVIQQAINSDLHIKYTPILHFELDPSLQKGDHVLAVLDELSHEEGHVPENDDDDDDA